MNSNEKESYDFLKSVEKITKKFNDNLKEFQPTAFLGSLSLIIATFSGKNFNSAQDYAIVAGFCFLLAFLTSVVITNLDLNHVPYLSIVPILFNSFGIIFLFLVSWEFAKASELLKRVIEIIKFLPIVIIYIIAFLKIKIQYYHTFKLSTIRSLKILSGVLLSIYIISCIILLAFASTKLYSLFWNVELNYPFLKNGLILGASIAGIVFFADMLIRFIAIFDEKKGIYEHSLRINDAINYNLSLGIVFVSFDMIFDYGYDFSFLGYLGIIMILVMNFILIIIKIKILPSLSRKMPMKSSSHPDSSPLK